MARTEVFAAVAARRVTASRAGTRIAISSAEFYHPAELPRQARRAAVEADLVVLDVGAFFVASGPGALDLSRLPRWAGAVHDRVRHLRAVTHRLTAAYPAGDRWVQLVETHAQALATGVLRPLVRRYPRPSLEEYERVLREAVAVIEGRDRRLVLQGPGGFNHDEAGPGYVTRTPEIYEEVNALARRVAESARVPLVDRMAIGRSDRALFLGGTSRYSALGHRVMGEVLGERLLDSGLV